MDITDPPKASVWYILGVVATFLAMGIASLYFAIIVSINLLSEISNQSDTIAFEKGAFYLFGAGFSLLLLVIGPMFIKLFKLNASNIAHIIFTSLLLGGVALTFILPQIAHFSVANYLEDEGYQICPEKSHRWLFVVTIVYTKSLPCSEE